MIFRVGLLCALLLAVTACTTDTTPGTPAPASATMAQFLQADPCGFVDSNALGVLGELTVAGADSFTSCSANITTPDGGETTLSIALSATLPYGDSAKVRAADIDGMPVYGKPTPPYCDESAAPVPGVVIAVTMRTYSAQIERSCPMLDPVMKSVVSVVRGKRFPRAPFGVRSLAWRDACTLLDPGDEPGTANETHPDFGSHACGWGATGALDQKMRVELRLGGTIDDTLGRTTVAGHEAWEADGYGDQARNSVCTLTINYQPPQVPAATKFESVAVTFEAPADLDSVRAQAIELATTVIGRLDD